VKFLIALLKLVGLLVVVIFLIAVMAKGNVLQKECILSLYNKKGLPFR
jgi:hypothetical protein